MKCKKEICGQNEELERRKIMQEIRYKVSFLEKEKKLLATDEKHEFDLLMGVRLNDLISAYGKMPSQLKTIHQEDFIKSLESIYRRLDELEKVIWKKQENDFKKMRLLVEKDKASL